MKFIIGLCLLCVGIVANGQRDIRSIYYGARSNSDNGEGSYANDPNWYNGYIVDTNNRVIKCSIKQSYFMPSPYYGYRLSPVARLQQHEQKEVPYNTIITPIVIYSKDRVRQDTMNLNAIREICMYADVDTFKFITVKLDRGGELFHVLQDGELKLLSREYFVNTVSKEYIYAQIEPYETTITPRPGTSAYLYGEKNKTGGYVGPYSGVEKYNEEYLLYYKDSLYRKRVDIYAFSKKNKDADKLAVYMDIFKRCPEFATKVSGDKYKEDEIELVIEEFNKCIANN